MSVEPICKLVRFVSRYFAVVQDRRAKGDELAGISSTNRFYSFCGRFAISMCARLLPLQANCRAFSTGPVSLRISKCLNDVLRFRKDHAT
jgi:hypothetical protein